MSRIDTALKLPRSGLTETMRALGAPSARPVDPRPIPQRLSSEFSPVIAPEAPKSELSSLRQWRTSSIISTAPSYGCISKEIQAILGNNGGAAATTSPIFGCSPPSRAHNPVVLDSKFQSSRPSGIVMYAGSLGQQAGGDRMAF